MMLKSVKSDSLGAMAEAAKALGVSGVAAVFVELNNPALQEKWWTTPTILPMGYFYRGNSETTVFDYAHVTMAKISGMRETHKSSGKGGVLFVYKNGITLYTAFSGDAEEHNDRIAQAGLAELESAFDKFRMRMCETITERPRKSRMSAN
jgi:hypothetical protein